MKKSLILVLVLLVALFGTTVTQAQESIAYGDVVAAEITDSEFEFEYSFTGEAGDVVVVNMLPVETFGDLDNPQIDILGTNGRLFASTANQFNWGSATLIVELEDSGEFTIIATRENGRSGDSVGEFTLELILVEMLEAGTVVTGSAETDVRPNYYGVRSDGEFAISFVKTGGVLPTEVRVNVIGDRYELDDIATMSGSGLTEGIFGVFEPDTLYIVTVGEPEFYFSFSTETADFELELVTLD